jgi:hypothetical protein
VVEENVKSPVVRSRGRKSDRKVIKRVTGDLAELVRDKTLAEVRSGRLKPTLQHGLMAQSMLDKREARAADRQLAIRIAAMLGGLVPPAGVILNVTPEQRLLEVKGRDDEPEFDPDDLSGV